MMIRQNERNRCPMKLILQLIVWGILILATICMYLYRRWLEDHEDHYIHLHDDVHDSSIIKSQSTIGKRLETVDKVKNVMLIVVILWGLAIAAMAVYQAWNANGSA